MCEVICPRDQTGGAVEAASILYPETLIGTKVDSEKLEYGPETIYADFSSSPGFRVGGESRSNIPSFWLLLEEFLMGSLEKSLLRLSLGSFEDLDSTSFCSSWAAKLVGPTHSSANADLFGPS